MDTLNLAVLGSGNGSNLQAILDAVTARALPAKVVCVISDVADAFILERARNAEIPAFHVDCGPSKSKLEGEAEQKVLSILREHNADTVVLAGFMRIVKPGLLRAFPERVLNIHPSLLPSFPGLNAWEQALNYGVRYSGCTVHFVDEGTDTGPIILQRTVLVHDRDTPESLHKRIQTQERIAYVEALRLLARGRLTIEGRRVIRLND